MISVENCITELLDLQKIMPCGNRKKYLFENSNFNIAFKFADVTTTDLKLILCKLA